MARKRKRQYDDENRDETRFFDLHPDTKKSIWAAGLVTLAIIFILAAVGKAGPAGTWIHTLFATLLGVGYFVLPVTLFLAAGSLLASGRTRVVGVTLVGAFFVILSSLGLIHIVSPGKAGWGGALLGSLHAPFGNIAAMVINGFVLVAGILATANVPLKIKFPERNPKKDNALVVTGEEGEKSVSRDGHPEQKESDKKETGKDSREPSEQSGSEPSHTSENQRSNPSLFSKPTRRRTGNYVPPPLSLLQSGTERPTTGDLRGNANIIKRTLEGFGIPVEMGEVNVGPKVTRYTLKPAEGVKLARITALHQDLALALAAHPIRIEAPIPGKSLVGIEVPNKSAALVRLGNLMGYKEFEATGPLGIALGRDVTGEPVFADIEKMPHLLIAGSTGSGKSVVIHSLLVSLLYRNGPNTLRLVLIDPKRVELTAYEGVPHLVSPVITENKKAIGVFRWALSEMERRYDTLSQAGNRDIKSYNASHKDEPIPYLAIVVDELADLMASYGREVEGSIVRLAQMARATGLHLILSTQRPSVEVITGLIKANITNRVALQVASQIDSRTILDTSGAEKLLGGGDLLFISSELSKPRRIQGAYISEDEIRKVTSFILEHNSTSITTADAQIPVGEEEKENASPNFDEFLGDEEDTLYEEAVEVVGIAGKASASLLQRRLKVGYARAARLLDIMEERGIIGPGEGAKPREVYMDRSAEHAPEEFDNFTS